MQAVLNGFERREAPVAAGGHQRRRPGPRAMRREASRVTAGHISHTLAGPATAVVGNLELARIALDTGDAVMASELVEEALASARELSGRLSSIQHAFEVDGLAR